MLRYLKKAGDKSSAGVFLVITIVTLSAILFLLAEIILRYF
jgi:hypothetical protein